MKMLVHKLSLKLPTSMNQSVEKFSSLRSDWIEFVLNKLQRSHDQRLLN